MSQFEIVKNLLAGLRKEEIRSLKRYLQLFEEGTDTNQLKSMALLELLLNKKNYPEDKICKKLYGDNSQPYLKTFNKMLLRFKDKVFELLTLDINLYRKDSYDDLTMAISEVRKLLLLANVLEGKAPGQEVAKVYEKIKVVSKSFELYDELLLALSYKINFTGQHEGIFAKNEQLTEIMFYDRCRHSLLKARDTYRNLVQLRDGYKDISDKTIYEQAIEELEHEYRYTKSASIGYILYDLSCHYYQAIKNYDAAERACHRVISIVSENKSVYRNERISKSFLVLAHIELLRYKFRQAESTLSRALVYSKGNHIQATQVAEISFLSFFFRGNFEKAELFMANQSALDHVIDPAWVSKCNFYLAAVKTVLGKTHEALLLLQQTTEIEKEHSSWNAGIRLLVIINLMEAEKLDAVESHIENFRKFLERSAKSGVSHSRSMLIVKILSRLANESFDFKQLVLKEKNNLSLLESNIPEFCWQPRTAELVIFPLWIKAKAEERKYQSMVNEWFDKHKNSTYELTLFD